MRPAISLTIPQPCHESWAKMTPTATGRHCAACQQTVVDFTLKTDAEILAYLAGAASGRTCGRFAAGQLERPLQRAVPVAPTRWRAWLAAAVAVWAVREGVSTSAKAQAPIEMRVLPAKEWQDDKLPGREVAAQELVLRGVVLDSTTREGLPGVTVLVKNSSVGTSTNHDGSFELHVPAELATLGIVELQISSVGYVTQRHHVAAAQPLQFLLKVDVMGMMSGVVVVGGIGFRRPWPWHPRSFYNWSKYWLARPLRGY